jgi:cytochrome P450
MQPVFHSKRIDGFAHTMLDYTTQMINGWKNDQSVDIKHEMTRLTMLIVGKTLFDADLSGAGAEIAEAMHFMSDDSNSQYQQGFIIPKWIPAPQNLRLEKARKRLDELLLPVIEARRQSGEDRGDLLSMLLSSQDAESGHKLSNQSIRDEVVALFIAGHETTANTLSWTLYLLATHLEIEAKVRAELSQVIGSRPPTVADLRNLPYLDWVIKESMRLYPPAWVLFGRSPIEPMKVGDYLLPTHVRLFLPPYTIHRSAKYYTHPEDFQPERWANDFEKTLPKYAYFPFGGGAHVCIGNSFALMEAKLILASILPRFQFTYLDSQPPEKHPLITLQPKEGLVMRVNVRETVMV